MDGLSKQLEECRTGCMVGDTLINHFMYADDLSLLSPSSSGFQLLLNICSNYGLDFNIKYNAKKSMVLICRTKDDLGLRLPDFYLSGQTISVAKSAKYLGHIITDTLEQGSPTFLGLGAHSRERSSAKSTMFCAMQNCRSRSNNNIIIIIII